MTRRLTLLPDRLSVCRLPADAPWPDRAPEGFVSVTRTAEELSIVCPESWPVNGARRSDGWRCLKLEGPFELSESGILAPLVAALGDSAVSVLPIATYDTDYLLVRQAQLAAAVETLVRAGCAVNEARRSSPAPPPDPPRPQSV